MYPEHVMSQAIRKSLRGQTKRVLLSMGTTATVGEIIDKLEGVFGNVAAGESMLQELYTTSQKQNETVAAWGLRLEEIVQRAIDKGHVREESKHYMLKSKFWKSLWSDKLKASTIIHYKTMQSFEQLQRAVRAEEYEMNLATGVQHQPIRSETADDTKFDQLMKKITALEKQWRS